VPVVVLGNGSNLLVADGEFDGVVLVLGEAFTAITRTDDESVAVVAVGAGLDLPIAARRIAEMAVTGFEWAVGVPGTLGGAAVMNAGGHGSDMAHCVRTVTTWSLARDRVEQWSRDDLDYGYRCSRLTATDVVLEVTLALAAGDADASKQEIREIVRWRREHQPGGANAGSVFRNPDHGFAGALIEAAGCKGRRRGTAHVSEKHANFIQVDDGGSANDVRALMEEVRSAVAVHSGVTLASEIRMVGFDGGAP
jgi:UDP-N-acetylmuramate dehydrogenase